MASSNSSSTIVSALFEGVCFALWSEVAADMIGLQDRSWDNMSMKMVTKCGPFPAVRESGRSLSFCIRCCVFDGAVFHTV